MSLPTVDFCGIRVSRLIIGANPFGGFSHQNARRDEEMKKLAHAGANTGDMEPSLGGRYQYDDYEQ